MTSILRAAGPIAAAAPFLLLSLPAAAQWNPPAGQWGKVEARDVRVMTWNVRDSLCSTNGKVEGANNWCAAARIVASFRPDVLLLQECGDNSGNGTGTGVDSVAALSTVLQLFFEGGNDPYHGGAAVTSYVQKYAPGYTLPYRFVSGVTDFYNRNVILSRFPFADRNGDGASVLSDIPRISTDLYAPGGDGGIRGFQFGEIDLPDDDYLGDLVVGNAHLKAGSSGGDHGQRLAAAKNVAYLIDYWLNGETAGVPDPRDKIADSPQATAVLDPSTPVLIGGDWNEDELTNGTKGPAEWLCRAELTGGSDGPDRDRSDMTWDNASHYFTGSGGTFSSKKYDYLAWQDSITYYRLQSVFSSTGTPAGSLPPEVLGFPNPGGISSYASDHRPVFVDFLLAEPCPTPTNYCTTSPNSSGSGALMAWLGTPSLSADDFHLVVTGAPPNKWMLFYYGDGQGAGIPFGNGWRCVTNAGKGVYRFPVLKIDALGVGTMRVDYDSPPAGGGGGGAWLAGDVWNCQGWFRDPAAGGANFNLSDGLELTVCP